MKQETIASDIRATIAARTAEQEYLRARLAIIPALDTFGDAPAALGRAIAARNASLAAAGDLKRIPAPRRILSARTVEIAEAIAHTASHEGGSYSGTTSYATRWGESASAETLTDKGSQYSRRCTYRKTDATHTVTLDPAGVALLVENEALRIGSKREGLHLIALYPDGSAVWVKPHAKGIVAERGWVAAEGPVCYHSTESLEHARKGLRKKLDAEAREARIRKVSAKQNRRARLVARLCGSLTATIEDARALGFCSPGIAAFQTRFGIGDSATLPELVRTGDPSAIRLALSLARKVANA